MWAKQIWIRLLSIKDNVQFEMSAAELLHFFMTLLACWLVVQDKFYIDDTYPARNMEMNAYLTLIRSIKITDCDWNLFSEIKPPWGTCTVLHSVLIKRVGDKLQIHVFHSICLFLRVFHKKLCNRLLLFAFFGLFCFARSEPMALQNSVWFWSKVRLMRLLPASLAFRSSGCFMLLQKNLSITSGNTCRLWKSCLPAQARWTCCVLLFLTLLPFRWISYFLSNLIFSMLLQFMILVKPPVMLFITRTTLVSLFIVQWPIFYCHGSCFTLTKKPSELC